MTADNDHPSGAQAALSAGETQGPQRRNGPTGVRARLHALHLPQPDPVSWRANAEAVTGWLGRQFSHPRVRLCVIGIALLLLGAVGVPGSVWTLPLIVVGAVMIVVAWMGARLNGRFAIEWGETGTQLEFRARIDPPEAVSPGLLAPPDEASARSAIWIPPRAETDDSEVIDGEAHTVEIDVAELKALIAAAEGSPGSQTGEPASASDPRERPAA